MKMKMGYFILALFFLISCTPPEDNQSTPPIDSSSENENNESSRPVTESQESPTEVAESFEPVTYELVEAYESLFFEQPLFFTSATDSSSNVFVVERTGRIYLFENHSTANKKEVFIDLSEKISTSGSEMGLLGLAFHPQFSQNGYFYVNYTTSQGTVLSRFEADPITYEVDIKSESILMEFSQPYPNHNGGHIAFGPEGYLYIGTGDGGGSGDPQNNAQNLEEIYGKLLRIDVDTQQNEFPYGIPEDNPFVGNTDGYREEIYAYGLRNPWKFSFDAQREWLWLADVGQDEMEEVNIVEAGKNYGWRLMEGTQEYAPEKRIEEIELEDPIWEYDHSEGQSITGGYVYYGDENPSLKGTYIYGDFISGKLWALWISEEGELVNVEIADTDVMISSFGVDERGEIIVVDLNGGLYRLKEIE